MFDFMTLLPISSHDLVLRCSFFLLQGTNEKEMDNK